MLTDAVKQEIRDRYQAISKAMPGFRSRPAQRVMIAEIAKTLARCPDQGAPVPGQTIVAIEAGTGTGKSTAYSVPGVVMALHKNRQLVISSSSIALQDQLVKRDLPFFLEAAGFTGVTVEIAKGRTHYCCNYRLAQAVGDMQQLAMFHDPSESEEAQPNEHLQAELESMAKDLADRRWDGDRDTRPPVPDELWQALTMDRHGCLNRACPYHRQCAQMAARKRVKEARVIVANHSLVLSDLAMGGGVILPDPANTFFVFDESHELHDKAVASFASSHLVGSDRRALDKMSRLAPALIDALGKAWEHEVGNLMDDLDGLCTYLKEVESFFASLQQLAITAERPRPTIEFQHSCLPVDLIETGENIVNVATRTLDSALAISEALKEMLNSGLGSKAAVEKLVSELGVHQGRLEMVVTSWRLFMSEPADESAPPVAKWVEVVPQKRGADFRVNASPVVAGPYLQKQLWDKAAGVVLTSATLSALGSFDSFLEQSGLSGYNIECHNLPSPFDYEAQGTLVIPAMPSPKNYEAHTAAVADVIADEIPKLNQSGMLVLFTSRRQMEDVARRLPPALADTVLLQGSGSKAHIIRTHQERIDAGGSSVIFGLDSFSTGVDLPRHYCSVVCIARLPFSVPDHPVLKTLSAWFERNGRDPFFAVAVPEAGRRLQQAVGRLIRTETDTGRVLVLDVRLWRSSYGRSILAGLPPFKIVAMGKEIA